MPANAESATEIVYMLDMIPLMLSAGLLSLLKFCR
jgi:hypothetical protein